MKRPLLALFALTALGILLLSPCSYQPDPVFSQGLYYEVTVTGQLATYDCQATTYSLTLTDCRIQYQGQMYQCSQLLVTVAEDTALLSSAAMTYPSDTQNTSLHSMTLPFQAGNRLTVTGSLSSFQPARNPGNFDWYAYYRAQHISYRVYADTVIVTDPQTAFLRQGLLTLRRYLSDQLTTACGEHTEMAALLAALLLGDKTSLEEDTRAKYEDGGILHILTVSGLHVSLLGTAVLTLGKKIHLPPWLRSLLSALLVLLYWQLCGAGMSSGRAAVMFLCLIAAPLLGRSYDCLSALSLAGTLILWDSPATLYQAGFQLSFGAVLGIQLVCPVFTAKQTPANQYYTEKHSPKKGMQPHCISNLKVPSRIQALVTSLLFGLGLQLTLLPITLYHFFRYPLYGIVLNLMVLPLTTPLFLLGTAGLLTAALLPAWGATVAPWVLLPCRWILSFYDILCSIALELPGSTLLLERPDPLRIGLYYGALALFCLLRSHPDPPKSHLLRRIFSLPLSLVWMLSILLVPLPTRSLSVTFLDVGQGDCAFIETPNGTTLLIDSGSTDIKEMADYRLTPFLESRGIDHLDYVFFSHTDDDHVNGVVDWLETGGSIGTALLPALPDSLASASSYQQLRKLLQAYQIPVLFFSQGMSWQEDGLTLTCLAPVPPDDPLASTYTDLNTASQVLLAEYEDIRILFTGDCEQEGEQLLLSYLQRQNITCHILKAGHHGSNYATGEALLQQLQPQAVVISCGIRNRYGHPHPSMLKRAEAVAGSCHITASCGAVMVTLRKGEAKIETFLPAGPLYYR